MINYHKLEAPKSVVLEKISNEKRVIFPENNLTKLDVANYYATFMQPLFTFLKNRLISVVRCHDNIFGNTFFQKHPKNPKFEKSFFVGKEEYFYLEKPQDILREVQFGALEFHIWASSISKIDQPDLMTFDLDPGSGVSFSALCEGVAALKDILDSLNLKSYLKTSGGKGFHILVPFRPHCNHEKFESFARQIALLAASKNKLFTTNIRKQNRKGKIFIDYLRNAKGATCASPYSLRARSGAPISFPISWQDLGKIRPDEITLLNFKNYPLKVYSDFFSAAQKIH